MSDHSHDHGHDHSHAHGDPTSREPLTEGVGAGQLLFLDAFSGIAGDMTIAALLDLGVPIDVVRDTVAQLPLEGYELVVGHTHRSGIVATTFDVEVDAKQPERTYGSIRSMLDDSPIAPAVRATAQRIFRRLGEAEAAVHRMELEDVHFHEVGAVDAIVDIVGAASAFAFLGARVLASPLPMGRGFVKARHGVLPLPAPATITCLQGVPTYPVDLDVELVTPTGAAIARAVAEDFVRWPAFAPAQTGFGAGARTLPDRPNLLRAVLGAPNSGDAGDSDSDTHVIVEANVDDLTGEVAGHALAVLLKAGAVDAWATPVTMKKGRPGLTIAALAPKPLATRVARTLLCETTTIGVRHIPVKRTVRPRRHDSAETPYGTIRVKISEGDFGPPQIKPELDDCVKAANAHDVPLRVVISAALAAYRATPESE